MVDYASFIRALEQRRRAFKDLGAFAKLLSRRQLLQYVADRAVQLRDGHVVSEGVAA